MCDLSQKPKKWLKGKHVVNSKAVKYKVYFCCIVKPLTVMTVSLFIKSPGCREEKFSHTVTASSNPLRKREKEPFEVPDISVFWNLFQRCFPCPQSFLRIAPFIWVTPVARFVLHLLASQKSWKWDKKQQGKLNYRGREKQIYWEKQQQETKQVFCVFFPAPFWGPLLFLPLACRAWPPSKEFSLYFFCLSSSVLL